MSKYRIITNGWEIRVQRKVFIFWINEKKFHPGAYGGCYSIRTFASTITAQEYIEKEEKLEIEAYQKRVAKWRVVCPNTE
jgi:hypothetical protein